MPTLFCTLCTKQWETSIHDVWICPHCEMGADDEVIAFAPDELRELTDIFGDAAISIQRLGIQTSYAVFPVSMHESYLSEAFLDLLVMLFDKIVLYIDTFNIQPDNKRIFDKLDAYIESGYIILFSWDNRIVAPISRRTPHISMNYINQDGWFHYSSYLQKLAEIQTYIDLQSAREEEIINVLKRAPIRYLREYASPDFLRHVGAHVNMLNRLNGFTTICELLNANILTDKILAEHRKLKSSIMCKNISQVGFAIPKLHEWYSNEISQYPKFERPETLIKYRKEIGTGQFLNYIIHHIGELRKYKEQGFSIDEELIKVITQNLDLAKKISGKWYESRKIILGGLVATLGSLVGGEVGAFLSGIVSTTIPSMVQKIDHQSIEPWASFFVS